MVTTSSVATAQNSCPTTNNSQLFSSAFNERRSSFSRRKAHANKKEHFNQFQSNNNDEEFPPFDDQTAALNIDDNRLESDKEEEQPDESVLHLYEELFCYDRIRLASNDFSRGESPNRANAASQGSESPPQSILLNSELGGQI